MHQAGVSRAVAKPALLVDSAGMFGDQGDRKFESQEMGGRICSLSQNLHLGLTTWSSIFREAQQKRFVRTWFNARASVPVRLAVDRRCANCYQFAFAPF